MEVDAVSNDYVLVRIEWLFERIDQVGAVTDEQIPEAAMRALKSIQEMLVQPEAATTGPPAGRP